MYGHKSSLPSSPSSYRSKRLAGQIPDDYMRKKYHPKCICPKQYAGLLCEKSNLCLDKCLNGGTCEWSKENIVTCNCRKGYEGESCEAIEGTSNMHIPTHKPKHFDINDEGEDDTDAVNRGMTTTLGLLIGILIIFGITIVLVLKCRTQRLGDAFRHRRMAESLLTGQPSSTRDDVPIGEFPNQMFLQDEPEDDIEEERKHRGIVKNRGRFRLKSQAMHNISSGSSSANFVNPVYQNLYGDGESRDTGCVRNDNVITKTSDTPSKNQTEENENSFLLIPSSSYDEEHVDDCDMVSSRVTTNRRNNLGCQAYNVKNDILSSDIGPHESRDLLTEKHRGDIRL